MSPEPGRRFATTRWSLVLATADTNPDQAQSALADLCQLYWFPVYAFVRRAGHTHEDASDLTQAFFTRVIEKDTFAAARPERGRFRTFLLTAVRHFLSNEAAAAAALKRGGGRTVLSLEMDDGERRYLLEPADEQTPERLYEQGWALTVLDAAMERLRLLYPGERKEQVFSVLRPLLTRDATSYAEAAASLDMTENNLRVALHRMRKQFGTCVREVIRETVERPEDVDDELRYLLVIVARNDAAGASGIPTGAN